MCIRGKVLVTYPETSVLACKAVSCGFEEVRGVGKEEHHSRYITERVCSLIEKFLAAFRPM